jgi:hypothetical protein
MLPPAFWHDVIESQARICLAVADEYQGIWYWLTPHRSGFLPSDLPFADALRYVERVVVGLLRASLRLARALSLPPLAAVLARPEILRGGAWSMSGRTPWPPQVSHAPGRLDMDGG